MENDDQYAPFLCRECKKFIVPIAMSDREHFPFCRRCIGSKHNGNARNHKTRVVQIGDRAQGASGLISDLEGTNGPEQVI
jgi:hypothetical protein